MHTKKDTEKELLQIIRYSVLAWLESRAEDYERYLANNIRLSILKNEIELKGKTAYLKYHTEYLTDKVILKYDESDHHSYLNTCHAFIDYKYNIEYNSNDSKISEAGKELYLLENINSQWKIIWKCICEYTHQ